MKIKCCLTSVFLFDDPGIQSLERIRLAPMTVHQSLAGESAKTSRRDGDHPMFYEVKFGVGSLENFQFYL